MELTSVDMPEYGRIHCYFPPGEIFKGGFDTYTKEINHFLDCIINDTNPTVDGYAGRAILEITLAAYESAKTRKTISLPLK